MAIAQARKAARDAGVPMSAIRGLTSEEEIQSVIDKHTGKSTSRVAKKKTVAKKATATKTRTTRTASRTAARKTTAKAAPKKTTARNSRTTRTAAKTAAKTTARKTTASKTTKRAVNSNGNGGRNLLDDSAIDWKVTEGWNPREGSAPDLILKALRKFRGNRERAFDALVGNLWDFVAKTDSKGRKRSKAEGEWQLRYRISRTAWDFAKRTGQHEPSTNRATYGEGGTGIGVSGGMPVQFRPDDFDGKPVFKRAKSTAKTTARKAAGGSKTAAKGKTATKTRTTAKARTTARTAAQKRTAAKTTTRGRRTTTRGRK